MFLPNLLSKGEVLGGIAALGVLGSVSKSEKKGLMECQ